MIITMYINDLIYMHKSACDNENFETFCLPPRLDIRSTVLKHSGTYFPLTGSVTIGIDADQGIQHSVVF